jgi:hypothetical protein
MRVLGYVLSGAMRVLGYVLSGAMRLLGYVPYVVPSNH